MPSASGALAVELHPHSPTRWIATYYPMNETPAGRWAEVTWPLHQVLVPLPVDPAETARWLEVRSADPDHPCYARHRAWAHHLAAGYTAARAAFDADAADGPRSLHEALRRTDVTTVVPAGQLSEWVLDDLEDETSGARR
ncbi:hypothetical protein RCG67_01220 [Kocuria sp. CPCC 205292]|uniref:hypothetical protein n=1 Tax=Kocuria cellulosilytica TaxID=3071451 RepID=UPI0034D3EBE5